MTSPARLPRADGPSLVPVRDNLLGALTIAGRPDQLRTARALVAGTLGADSDLTETAVLLASELIANSVQHSHSRRPGGRITIRLLSVASGLRVEVTDAGAPTVPVLACSQSALAECGRGLRLVEALADRWGYEPGRRRLMTWFELDGAAAPPGPGPVPGAASVSRFAHRGHRADAPLVPSPVPGRPPAPACCVLRPWIVILDSELVRQARRAAGLSQERLAFKSGVSRTTICRLEHQSHPRCHFRTRYLIAIAMGTDPLAITANFS
jgi:anti-sigma regulatory factor (Ser/Thr protein kinase)/DNA-binding XRE family transcriptional regulator